MRNNSTTSLIHHSLRDPNELKVHSFCRTYADRIVGFLKTAKDQDKIFRMVKKSGFQLSDLPEAGLRDVLVVKVQEAKQVSLHILFIILILG